MKRIALTLLISLLALPAFAGGVSMDNSKSTPMMSAPVPQCGPWYVSIGGGTAWDIGGNFIESFRANVPIRFLPPGSVVLDSRGADYSDIYNNSVRLRGELGYALLNRFDVFAKFEYEQMEGGSNNESRVLFSAAGAAALGNFAPNGPLGNGGGFAARVNRSFDDYQRWGGELGARFHILPRESRVKLWVAGAVGASEVGSIGYQSNVDFGGFVVNVYNGPLYDDTLVFTASGTVGAEYELTRCASIGVDVGVNYHSGLDANDSGFKNAPAFLGTIGIDNLNFARRINDDNGSRWSIPVTVFAKIQF